MKHELSDKSKQLLHDSIRMQKCLKEVISCYVHSDLEGKVFSDFVDTAGQFRQGLDMIGMFTQDKDAYFNKMYESVQYATGVTVVNVFKGCYGFKKGVVDEY